MDKIIDYKCTYNNNVGIDEEIADGLGLTFPDVYMHSETLRAVSLTVKEKEDAPFCVLPLCHTVEGSAMGADINYGNSEFGPRAGKQICRDAEDFLALPDIDFNAGRIAEVLKACRELRQQGEHVLLEISGPFTILDTLMDARAVFRTMRKRPDMMAQMLEKLRRNILAYFMAAQDYGVDMISYADSAGGVNILGPKFAEGIVRQFTYPLLKDVENNLRAGTLTIICPKTSFALIGTGLARWEDVILPGTKPVSYGEGCVAMIGRAAFAGQMCIKNHKCILESGSIKSLRLI